MEQAPAVPMLEVQALRKRFPGVLALDGVDLDVRAGEVHALVGENGAGKSTLIRIASGLERADGGELRLAGARVEVPSPSAARQLGIALVHQEPDLFPDLSVVENLFLGRGMPCRPPGWIDWSAARERARRTFAELDEDLDVRRSGRSLGAAQRQLTDIAAALAQDVRVLFLDEPTAALSRKETAALFARIRRLRERGVAVVYVTHRLEEVLELADRVTVLRDGRRVFTRPVREIDAAALVAAMVGREVDIIFPRTERPRGDVRLSVQSLSTNDERCHDLSFTVRQGEIVGLYGLVGAGRSELAQALAGLRPHTGQVTVDGAPVDTSSARASLAAGMAYVPEDRLDQALFLDQSTRTNATVAELPELASAGVVRPSRERSALARMVAQLQVKVADVEEPVGTLSGGNQQKVVLGRWLLARPKVLLLDEPTRGVDVGAKAEIHSLIQRAAAEGVAVVLISSELPEVLGTSDRVLVLREGRLAGEFDPRTARETDVAAAAFPTAAGAEDAEGAAETADRAFSLLERALAQREVGLAAIVLTLGAALTATTDAFLTWANLRDILHNIASLAIAGTGMTLVIASGAIDISVGAMLALCAASTGLAVKAGTPLGPALLLGVGLGALLGLVNAAISVAGRVHSIIVTLGTISIFRSLLILMTDGKWITDLPASFTALAGNAGLPIPVWIMLGVVGAGAVFQARTHAGRCLYAVGGNERAARTAGLRPGAYRLLAFGVLGALVGLAAVLDAARIGSVQTNAGLGFELKVIAATVIGGTNIMGGSGTVAGTLLGALLLQLLYNACVLWNISAYWEQLLVGLLILAAVLIDASLRRRAAPV